MTPYIAALEHCLRLLAECKEGKASLCISNEQISKMKPRSIQNRVRHNLSHQLADLITSEAEISKVIVASENPSFLNGDDTQFTLRTVVMKASTYLDLQAGLNSLLSAALEQELGDQEPVARGALCTCGLARRAIVPEEHDDSCPVVLSKEPK